MLLLNTLETPNLENQFEELASHLTQLGQPNACFRVARGPCAGIKRFGWAGDDFVAISHLVWLVIAWDEDASELSYKTADLNLCLLR